METVAAAAPKHVTFHSPEVSSVAAAISPAGKPSPVALTVASTPTNALVSAAAKPLWTQVPTSTWILAICLLLLAVILFFALSKLLNVQKRLREVEAKASDVQNMRSMIRQQLEDVVSELEEKAHAPAAAPVRGGSGALLGGPPNGPLSGPLDGAPVGPLGLFQPAMRSSSSIASASATPSLVPRRLPPSPHGLAIAAIAAPAPATPPMFPVAKPLMAAVAAVAEVSEAPVAQVQTPPRRTRAVSPPASPAPSPMASPEPKLTAQDEEAVDMLIALSSLKGLDDDEGPVPVPAPEPEPEPATATATAAATKTRRTAATRRRKN